MSDRLSSELLWHSEVLEREMLEDLTAEDRKEYEAHQTLVEAIAAALIATRETMRSDDFTAFEKFANENREIVDSLLDTHYTIAGLENVGLWVQRTMLLAQLHANSTPSPQKAVMCKRPQGRT